MPLAETFTILIAFAAGWAVIWIAMSYRSKSVWRRTLGRLTNSSQTQNPHDVLGTSAKASAVDLAEARERRIAEIHSHLPAIQTAKETEARRVAVETIEEAYRAARRSLKGSVSADNDHAITVK